MTDVKEGTSWPTLRKTWELLPITWSQNKTREDYRWRGQSIFHSVTYKPLSLRTWNEGSCE